MTGRPELRPCPFCGAPNEDIVVVNMTIMYPDGEESLISSEVRCGGCHARLEAEDRSSAINAWNSRGDILTAEEEG